MVAVESRQDLRLMAHLLRRAGFGATPDELDRAMDKGYDAVLDELLNPARDDIIPFDLIRRYHVDQSNLHGGGAQAHWIYRLAVTDYPLREKMSLFWHRVFATGSYKLIQTRVVTSQIDMFREHGMGNLDNLLVRLSRDPAMIMWLDNQDNHKGSINENYGRELLELFSMGVGNYTEEDIKECARAFTGWGVVNPDYMMIKMRNNTSRPYGNMTWQFEYDDDDHDHGQKNILGETGDFNGEDVVEIICRQEATPRYIARHLYHYFVADEPPVPQWPHTPPANPDAIDAMTEAYFESGHSVKHMLKTLFTSDFFKEEALRYSRTKSPTEMVVSTLRLAGRMELPCYETYDAARASSGMGQALMGPPSVEGWQGGAEWINTGTYVERVNFVSRVLGDPTRPGVRGIINRIGRTAGGDDLSPEGLINACLKVLGPMEILDSTRANLTDFASTYGRLSLSDEDRVADTEEAVVSLIQLIVSTQEYQML
ncbi:MAG: DUF1800 domain-containing protein [Dehalococcoidia bacterium]|nr:DUF1800 domain-containing protein [Dehalococcoidia bacterium]